MCHIVSKVQWTYKIAFYLNQTIVKSFWLNCVDSKLKHSASTVGSLMANYSHVLSTIPKI